MPEKNILGDKFDPYMCFTNSHDGTGAVKVCMTPVRVVCNNTLNMALNTATRCWSTKHIGDISSKLEEARYTLKMADKYMTKLDEEADKLANQKISEDEIAKILDEMFPVNENDSDRKKANKAEAKNQIMICYMAPDIAKFLGTKYGFLNAVSDWCGHATPKRMTNEYASNNWGRIMDGHPVFDLAYSLCTKGAA
jgi:phage/plasmid-like protein (TIGR03299 family)